MKQLRLLGFVALTALLTQCYPGGADYVEELDLVYSRYDVQKDFTTGEGTYSIPDKILKIDEDLIDGNEANYVKEPYATDLLNRIKSNMTAKGWQLVAADANPDVLIAPAAFELTSTFIYSWYPYYDWWYGGYYPGGGYGWYYPYPVVESYTTGSLVVNMVDQKVDVSVDDKRRVIWTFVVNGLMEGGTANFASRMNKGVDQAFIQSPYLNIK